MAGAPLPRELAQQTMDAMKACNGVMSEAARMLGIARSTFEARYHRAKQYEIEPEIEPIEHPGRIELDIENGKVLIGSDAHYWPGRKTTAHRAFVKACQEFQPRVVIMNGDVVDGATASRHAPIGWEDRPSLAQEIEVCQERLGEITFAAGKARRIWSLGNHDSRLETRLATVAPEFAKVHGVHLHDHFPDWEPCWSSWISDTVVVKHRFRGGWSATRNNTLMAGKSMVTGHLHSLRVTPLTDYNGTRFGIDSGCLAACGGPQFVDYLETSPTDWRAGFVMLTFSKGRMLWPELIHVVDEAKGLVEFRDQEYIV
jgi:hypothetical protein